MIIRTFGEIIKVQFAFLIIRGRQDSVRANPLGIMGKGACATKKGAWPSDSKSTIDSDDGYVFDHGFGSVFWLDNVHDGW